MDNQNNHKDILELSTIDLLIEKKNFLLNRILRDQKEIEDIDRMTGIKPTNGHYSTKNIRSSSNNKQQDKKRKSWAKPILKLLGKENRLLKTREIVTILYPNIPENTLSDYIITVSGVLYGLCNREKIKQYKSEGEKGDYYGLPDFFNGDKPKHEYAIK